MVIKEYFQKHLKIGKNILKWVKAKIVRRGEGGPEGVTSPAPENFNRTLVRSVQFYYISDWCLQAPKKKKNLQLNIDIQVYLYA